MAQNVTIAGAAFSAVPAIEVPKTGGGIATFADPSVTTATASDVASGKYFLDSSGVLTQGTASGGGGGASNLVQGSFTAQTTTGVQTITLPYTGSGYPVTVMIAVQGGAYNPDTEYYSFIQRYTIAQFSMHKSVTTSVPTYTTSGAENQGVTEWIYKSSASSAATYSRSSVMSTNSYSSSNAGNSGSLVCRFKNAKTMTVYVQAVNSSASTYGFLAGITFDYSVIYSS